MKARRSHTRLIVFVGDEAGHLSSRVPVELQLEEGELGRVGDGVDVVDHSGAGLELNEREELAVPEGKHARVPVDGLRDQRKATGWSEESEGAAADHSVAVQRPSWRNAGPEVHLADHVRVEQPE